MSEFCRTTPAPFDAPPIWEVTIPTKTGGSQHTGIIANFVEAILDGVPLLAPAAEGIRSVELANAMLLSSFEQETISLPLDGARYEKWLRARIAGSKAKLEVPPVAAGGDFSKSFLT
jgi:hypothetical protein